MLTLDTEVQVSCIINFNKPTVIFKVMIIFNFNDLFRLYDKDGYYLKQIPIVNLTLRTGFFGVDDNMDYMTQGSFRQGAAREDYISDPDVSAGKANDLTKL